MRANGGHTQKRHMSFFDLESGLFGTMLILAMIMITGINLNVLKVESEIVSSSTINQIFIITTSLFFVISGVFFGVMTADTEKSLIRAVLLQVIMSLILIQLGYFMKGPFVPETIRLNERCIWAAVGLSWFAMIGIKICQRRFGDKAL